MSILTKALVICVIVAGFLFCILLRQVLFQVLSQLIRWHNHLTIPPEMHIYFWMQKALIHYVYWGSPHKREFVNQLLCIIVNQSPNSCFTIEIIIVNLRICYENIVHVWVFFSTKPTSRSMVGIMKPTKMYDRHCGREVPMGAHYNKCQNQSVCLNKGLWKNKMVSLSVGSIIYTELRVEVLYSDNL